MKTPPHKAIRDVRLASLIDRFPLGLQPVIGNGATVLVSVNVLRTVLRLASNLVLTRILAPEAFGVIGVVTSISYILVMLSDMGFLAYVIRHKREDSEFLSVVWTVRLARSLLLTAMMVAGAGIFADLYGNPALWAAIAAASLTFVFEGVSSISYLVATRHGRVIRVSLLELAETASLVLVTIIAALIMKSYWAIIIGMYWAGLIRVATSYLFFPPLGLRLSFNREVFDDLWAFARVVIPSSMITIVLMQTDKLFMARYFPLEELGVFMLASTLAVTAAALIDQYAERIMYPIAARADREGGADGKAILYRSKRRLFLVFAFGLGGLIAGSELVIRILFDDRYLGAAFYLTILAFIPLLKLSTAPAMYMLIAKGFIKATLSGNIVRLAFLAVAGPIGFALVGPIGVIVALSAAEIPVMIYYWWKLKGFHALSLREEGYLAAAALAGGLIGYGVNALANTLVANGVLPSF